MKNIIIKTFAVSFLFLLAGCDGMDEMHKKFVVPGGIIYPQRALNVKVHSGDGRAMLTWDASNDPSVTGAVIYWENYAYSDELVISGDEVEISKVIPELAEGDYNFTIFTLDDKGNRSVPVEISGVVYGDAYRSTIFPRPVESAVDRDGKFTIEWGVADASNYMASTELRYSDENGITQTLTVSNTDNSTIISDYKKGTRFEYRSLFTPGENNLDVFDTPWKNINFMLDKSSWDATCDNFEPTGQLPLGGPPHLAINYDITTYWHTQHTGVPVPYPHWFAVDMQAPAYIYAVELTRRPGRNENFQQYTLQGSDDGNDWTDIGIYPFLYNVDGPQRAVVPSGITYRHLRIYITKGEKAWAHLAEFSVIGYYSE